MGRSWENGGFAYNSLESGRITLTLCNFWVVIYKKWMFIPNFYYKNMGNCRFWVFIPGVWLYYPKTKKFLGSDRKNFCIYPKVVKCVTLKYKTLDTKFRGNGYLSIERPT